MELPVQFPASPQVEAAQCVINRARAILRDSKAGSRAIDGTTTRIHTEDPELVGDVAPSQPLAPAEDRCRTCRAVVERAAAILSRHNAEAERDVAIPKARPTPPRVGVGVLAVPTSVSPERLQGARDLLQRARAINLAHIDTLLDRAVPLVSSFKGLPVSPNLFEIAGIEDNEAAHQRVLNWLLLPHESHGLGDRFLRRFMGRIGIAMPALTATTFESGAPSSILEFEWNMPPAVRFSGGALRVDILLVAAGQLFPIECKVDAVESTYQLFGGLWRQTAAYAKCVGLALSNGRQGSLSDEERLVRGSVLRSLSGKGARTMLGAQRAVGVLVHRPGSCSNDSSTEHGMDVRHITWLDICEIIAQLDARRELPSSSQHILRSFQTTVLQHSSAGAILTKLEDLRLVVEERRLAIENPVATWFALHRMRESLNKSQHCGRKPSANRKP